MMLCMPTIAISHLRPAGGGHWTYFPAAATSTSEIDGLTIEKINPDILPVFRRRKL